MDDFDEDDDDEHVSEPSAQGEHEGEGGAEEQEPGPSHGIEGGDRTPPRLVIDDGSEGDEVVEQEGRDEGGWLPEQGEVAMERLPRLVSDEEGEEEEDQEAIVIAEEVEVLLGELLEMVVASVDTLPSTIEEVVEYQEWRSDLDAVSIHLQHLNGKPYTGGLSRLETPYHWGDFMRRCHAQPVQV
ncbi:unnamed protein product [Strongylus vulgaris]|uniref:Uncharacterized protein n=1 Tax=Strongylus vulgaris TaxID=40348 RepID=A0A3P7JEQ1_STRVU|nr:unnamed protein product [Strongylus vulgaris]